MPAQNEPGLGPGQPKDDRQLDKVKADIRRLSGRGEKMMTIIENAVAQTDAPLTENLKQKIGTARMT